MGFRDLGEEGRGVLEDLKQGEEGGCVRDLGDGSV